MQKKWTKLLFAIMITLLFSIPNVVAAETPPTDEETIAYLQEAQQAQFSLGEKHRNLAEIHEILDPYFTRDYQEQFLEEHLFEEKEGYITYGTDFTIFYIPFFSFDENTKIHRDKESDKLYAYEFFDVDESMPYLYEPHFEYVELEYTQNGLVVSKYGNTKKEPYFLKEKENGKQTSTENVQPVGAGLTTDFKPWSTKTLKSLEELQKENVGYLSLYPVTTPFGLLASYIGTQPSTAALYQSLPIFTSQLFIASSDGQIVAMR